MKTRRKPGPLSLLLALAATLSLATLVISGTSSADEKSANNIAHFSQSKGDGAQEPAVTQNPAVPAIPQNAQPLKGKTIVVDPGHGGKMSGAVRTLPASPVNGGNPASANKRKGVTVLEKDLTLAISLKLAKELEKQGATVIMTRVTDTDVSLEDRVTLANSINPDLFLSVHINAHTNSTVDGIETYYWSAQSECAARYVFESLVKGLKAPGNWVSARELYVVHHTLAPAVLAEVGYMSNRARLAKLVTASYQQEIAEALAGGVVDYFGKPCSNAASVFSPSIFDGEILSPPKSPAREPEACSIVEKQD